MDITKRKKSRTHTNDHTPRSVVIIAAGITMLIIAAWSIFLLPNTLKKTDEQKSSFTEFKNTISHSLKLLKKNQTSQSLSPDSSIDELRSQVFGDSISR